MTDLSHNSSSADPLKRALVAAFAVSLILLVTARMTSAQDATSPLENPSSPDVAASDADVEEAEKQPAIPKTPEQIIRAIGIPFALIFGAASVVSVFCGVERLVLLRRRRVIPRAFSDRFLQHLRSGRMDKAHAIAVCQQDNSPMADVFLHGVRKWGKPSVEIEQAVIDGGERQISQLKKRLRVLNGVATLSPLVGLLGTVIGMIQAFNDIAESNAMGQAEQLARGIAMALLTTAAGLFIAIPALAAYLYLSGRIDGLVMEMDHLGQELVHLISGEALRERNDLRARDTATGKGAGQNA